MDNTVGIALPQVALHDGSAVLCPCPCCSLSQLVGQLYAPHSKSSPVVLRADAATPGGASSGYFVSEAEAARAQALNAEEQAALAETPCPMDHAFGFCFNGPTCFLAHGCKVPQAASAPRVPIPSGPETAFTAVLAVSARHDDGAFVCGVCGLDPIPSDSIGKVGEVGSYVVCPACCCPAYHPQLVHLVIALLTASNNDAAVFKRSVDAARLRLPHELRLPFSYESHRLCTSYFGWTLADADDAATALVACSKAHARFARIVSVGSGTGYTEHVFSTVANAARGSNAFTAIHKVRPISVVAYDEVIRVRRFSVDVAYGSPDVLLTMDCTDAVLLLAWPPFGSQQQEQSSMGFEALRNYVLRGGRCLVYIGDVASTGDWRFHEMLHTHFVAQPPYHRSRREVSRWNPSDMGLVYAGNDTIGVYALRPEPLTAVRWQWSSV